MIDHLLLRQGYPRFMLSADWRPYFRLIDHTDISYGGFGLNIRYVF